MKKELLVELNEQELEDTNGGEYEVLPPDYFLRVNWCTP